MTNRNESHDESKTLRQQAEGKVRPMDVPIADMSEADITAAVHELQVHQVELEMQNDELNRTQTDLEQSRTKYADLFDFAPVGYVVLSPEGLIVEANLTAATMVHVERSRLRGKSFTSFAAPPSRDTFRHHYAAVFRTGQTQEGQIEIKREEGQGPLVVRLRSQPVTDGAGHVVQCRTAMMNITDLARVEERLRDSERRFRTLAENSPDIIARIDARMRIVYVNRLIETVLDIPQEEFLGRTLDEVGVPATLAAQWAAAVQRVFQTGKAARTDFDCHCRQEVRHCSATLAPEFEEDGSLHTVLATIRDITDRVHAEEKYSTVIRSLQDGFAILDAEGRYVEANDEYGRMLGYDPEDLLRMTVWDALEPALHEELRGHVQTVREQGWDKFRISHRRRDGSRVDCDVTIQKLNGDRFFVFARDITAQRLAEEQHLESLRRFEMVARAANDGIWDWDLTADTCWHNETYAALFGYHPDEVQDSTEWWRERIHPEDRDPVVATLDRTVRDGTDVWSAKYRLRRKDESYAWVMDRGYMIRDHEGKAVRMVGSTMDLTEKLELVEQLENKRSELEAVLDTTTAAIIVVDAQGGIRYANGAARKLHGQPLPSGEHLETHKDMGLYHLDGTPYEPQDLPLVRAALHGETQNDAELLVKRPDGEIRHTLFNTSPLTNREGNTTGAVAVIQDITELKAAEQALRDARDQLEERVRERTAELDQTVETLNEQVAEKVEAQNQLEHQNRTLQAIVNNIPVMLCFFDGAGHIALINHEFTRVLGYSLEDLREHGLLGLAGRDPKFRQEVWDHMMTPEPQWRDFLIQTKKGDPIISSWATVQLVDGSYVGIGIDLRERKQIEGRLRESEQQYRTLVELSPDAISVEREGIVQFVNTAAVKLLGAATARDLVGRPLLDLMHPDSRPRTDRQLKYVRRRRKPMSPTEERIVRLDGKELDVEMATMPIAFEGAPANQIVLHDITQRKQVELRLRDNAMQLQQQAELLNLAHDSIVVNDMEGRVVFWNRGAEQTYGWTRDEAVGKISHDLLRTRFPANLIEITARLLSQGRWNGEVTHTTRSGETIIVSSRWALQRNEDSLPTGILVIDRDVTVQKRAEQAMIEARRLAESITNTVQESLLVLDADLKVLSANETFYRTFEVRANETEGRYIYEIDRGQWDIPELRTLLEDILPHNSSFEDFEVEHDFDRIGHRTMLLNARRIYRQEQETEMILLAIQDITIRKEQERRIRLHQQELASLTEELLLAEERERRRIALILHDSIGQSLSFSKREIGVLQKKSAENVRKDLESVKEQIDLAIRQTRDLTFELSPTTLHTFGLEAAVEELAEQLAPRGNLEYRFTATEEDKPVSEQIKTLLYRAAREVLLNIIKHADARNVSIHIERVNESVRMTIEDDGKGFDVSRLDQVGHQQNGFGLFSIRERLTYVGGTFAIESQPGEGTRVVLTAPLQGDD